MILTDTQLDKTIFERIRLAAVAAGYLPDITAMANAAAYTAAKDAIKADNTKGFIVEVFGTGSGLSRDEKSICKIVIDRHREELSGIGGRTIYYEDDPDNAGAFVSKRAPESQETVSYRISTIGATRNQERVMNAILRAALKRHDYFAVWDDDLNDFSTNYALLTFDGSIDAPSPEFVERKYMYSFRDVWLQPATVLRTNIQPMNTIGFYVVVKPVDGEYTTPADPDNDPEVIKLKV